MPVKWLLFSYRLPREPSRLRLAAWRRLRHVGAQLLHGSLWILPADAATLEHLEWLAEEIEENGGSALLWEALDPSGAQARTLTRRFRAETEARYGAIAASAAQIARAVERRRTPTPAYLRHAARQLQGLARAIRLEGRRDYFGAEKRREAEAAVRTALQTVAGRAPSAPQPILRHALDHATALPR